MALFFLFLLPLVASHAVSINYRNASMPVDTHITIQTNLIGNFNVLYSIYMSNPKVTISVDGNPSCTYQNPPCNYLGQLGNPMSITLNYGTASSYTFFVIEERVELIVIAEGCTQDIETDCRRMNFTSSQGMICFCNGESNFCTDDPLPVSSISNNCLAGTVSPSLTTVTLSKFSLSVMYGTSHGLPSHVMDISRRDLSNQVQFIFTLVSTSFDVFIDGIQCSPNCQPRYISVGESLFITIQQQFNFSLYQIAQFQTDVIYLGCVNEIDFCRDTPNDLSSYGCLCPGATGTCSNPTPLNNTCSNGNDSTTTSVPITISNTPTLSPDWILRVFYGKSAIPLELTLIRKSFSAALATFDFYSMDYPVEVNGRQCYNCTQNLTANNRMDVIINNNFHFYLYENATMTAIGLGDGTCNQVLSNSCKSGQLTGGYSGCLCENQVQCTSPKEFDECTTSTQSAPSTNSSTLSTINTTISTTAMTTTTMPTTTTTTTATTTASRATTITTMIPISIPSLQNLSDSTIGQNNVTQILNDTLVYSNNKNDLTTDQVDDISIILSKSANVENLNETDSQLILINLDNCLYASYNSVSIDAASRMNSLFLPLVQNTNADKIDYLNGVNLGFSSRQVDCLNYNPSDQGLEDNITMFLTITNNPTATLNSIRVSMTDVCTRKDVSHVFFTMYRDRKLFVGQKMYRTYNNKVWEDNRDGQIAMPWSNSRTKRDVEITPPNPCDRQTSLAVDSPVMSGTILSNNGATVLSRLAAGEDKTVAQLQFNIQGLLVPLHGKFVVTWWDPDNYVWATSDQCTTERKGDMVHASCPHLTDFTLIVDGALDDPSVCDSALSITGYVVNGLSIASLSFLCVVYLCAYIPVMATTKAMRYMNGYAVAKRDSVSLSYTTSLLLFYIVFTFFATQDMAGNACSAMAAIAYSLFLATIMMNVFKCLRMMAQFLPGRTKNFFEFIQRAVVFDTISIGISFVTSLLLLLLSDFFHRNDSFCWVRVDYIVFATIIPISILVINAAIATSLAAYRLFATRLHVQRRGRQVDYNLGGKLINILILQFTLGMPWVLQYFTLGLPKTTAWHYAFTIILGSQGTILALLFFYKRQRLLRSSKYAKKLASQQTQGTRISDSNTS